MREVILLDQGNSTDQAKEHLEGTLENSIMEESPHGKGSIQGSAHLQLDPNSQLKTAFKWDWMGTSQHFVAQNLNLQREGHLQTIIDQRNIVAAEVRKSPYDPMPWLTSAFINNQGGFADIAVAQSYRILILINAALSSPKGKVTTPAHLGPSVQKSIFIRLSSHDPTTILEELLLLKKQAYTILCASLCHCAAFYDGFRWSKIALKQFPGDRDLLELQKSLRMDLEVRRQNLGKDVNPKDRIYSLKTGFLYPRPYPWLDQSFFIRTPQLLREINKSITWRNCEARTVAEKVVVQEGADVGCLGVFATQDLKKGDMIMVDKTITGISNVPASTFEHCDLCHAVLSAPYIEPHQVVKAKCCDKVAFCSQTCHEQATNGYHKILCDKEFDWLYRNIGFDRNRMLCPRWKAIGFLRIMAIILADNQELPKAKRWHPLVHPLVSRMTASYVPHDTLHPMHLYEWYLEENVMIPTRILTQLGVDIFDDPDSFYSQEVIQTIYLRIDNNANTKISNLVPGKEPVHTASVNPNYLFLNHSCEPNVIWQSSISDREVSLNFSTGGDGDILRAGDSSVRCYANRPIKAGEELKISYIGNPLGDDNEDREMKRKCLGKWFQNGCGCRTCEAENVSMKNGGMHA